MGKRRRAKKGNTGNEVDPIQNMKDINKAFRAELYNNGIGNFQTKLKDAQEKQLRFLKEGYLSYDNIVENSDNNSEEHQLAKKGKTDVEKKFQSIAVTDDTLGSQIEETAEMQSNISNANNPQDELLVNQVATGNCGIEINDDGDKEFLCVDAEGNDVTLTENDLSNIQNNIIPRAHRLRNDLITIASGLTEKLGLNAGLAKSTAQADNEQKVDQSIWTALNVPSDASDQDPQRIINQKKSMIADSLVGKPSLSDWLMSKEGLGVFQDAFPNAQSMGPWEVLNQMNNELDEGNSDLFDQVSLPYVKDQYFPQLKDKVTQNIPGIGDVPIEDVSSQGTLKWDAGYERWKEQGNEGTMEDFKQSSNEWWDSDEGQAYAKENDFKHRIKERGTTTDETTTSDTTLVEGDHARSLFENINNPIVEEEPKKLTHSERASRAKELGISPWVFGKKYDAFGNKK